jgi:hypothetical protein
VKRAYSEVVPLNVAMHEGSLTIMDTDRKREEVAANLENMAARIAELQDVMHEGRTPSAGTLDRLQQNVEQASDAIAAVLDPERARKP